MGKKIAVTLPIDEATAIFDALAWAYRLDETSHLTEDEQREWWAQVLATFDNECAAINAAFYRIDAALYKAEQSRSPLRRMGDVLIRIIRSLRAACQHTWG